MKRGSPKNRQFDFWIGAPLLNLLAALGPRHRVPPREIRTIGVICSPALGDTLLFSGALLDLRSSFPDAHIVHITMKQNAAAAESIPGADERLSIRLTRPFETMRRLRAQRFDLLLDFTSWQRLTAAYTLLAGARWTVGFRSHGQFRSRGYDRRVLHRDNCHEIVNFRSLLLGTGLDHPMQIGHAPRIEEGTASGNPPFPEEGDIIALHLWASGQRSWLREWPENRWVELAQRLRQTRNGVQTLFLITGSPADEERIRPFVEQMREAGLRCDPFISPDGFRTLTRVLRQCRLVVSVNTGVMHLAAIAGARVIGINGPNRNGRWGPVGPWAIGVEAPGEGCGYLHLGFNFADQMTDCMERTTVDQVFQASLQLQMQPRQADKSYTPARHAEDGVRPADDWRNAEMRPMHDDALVHDLAETHSSSERR